MKTSSALRILFILLIPVGLTACAGQPGDPEGSSSDAQAFMERGLRTETSSRTVELDEFVGGGPGKDDIPALTDPDFIELAESSIPDDVRGVLVEIGGEKRFYPYNVMVWHEVANDEIAGTPVAVTF